MEHSGEVSDPTPFTLLEYTPGKCGGRACIKGTRITAINLAELYVDGFDAESIAKMWPELTPEHVRQAVAYCESAGIHLSREGRDEYWDEGPP